MGMSAKMAEMSTAHPLIGSDRVEGTPVRRRDGRKLGEIKRLMIDKVSGQVAYAVMSFGGFLGMGGRYHAVPWQELRYDSALGAYELDISEDWLHDSALLEAEEYDWGERGPDLAAEYGRARHWGV